MKLYHVVWARLCSRRGIEAPPFSGINLTLIAKDCCVQLAATAKEVLLRYVAGLSEYGLVIDK